jgi:hypothetical protein
MGRLPPTVKLQTCHAFPALLDELAERVSERVRVSFDLYIRTSPVRLEIARRGGSPIPF